MNGLWRYSPNRLLRSISLFLCWLGYHDWLWYRGRPLECPICGLRGCPEANQQLDEQVQKWFERQAEQQK